MRARVRWGWLVAALGVLLLAASVVFTQKGECFDYVNTEGVCRVEPVVGIAGAWVIGVASVAFAVYAAARASKRQTKDGGAA